MTIIDVARELEKDGTKAFTRPGWRCHSMTTIDLVIVDMILCLDDLLATDWEEVKE